MELEGSQSEFKPEVDRRERVEEPPPVRLVTVDDARLPAPAGVEEELRKFYVGVLKFEVDEERRPEIVFVAENFDLIFDVVEPPMKRDDLRRLGVEVPSLRELEKVLIELEIEHAWEKGLTPGTESIVLLDPAGNWLQITEFKIV